MAELLKEKGLHKGLPYPLESYNMTQHSSFLDIGSGFGKPVFHAAMQTSKIRFI